MADQTGVLPDTRVEDPELSKLREECDRTAALRHDIRKIVIAIQYKLSALFAKRIDKVQKGKPVVLTASNVESLRMIKRGVNLVAAMIASRHSEVTFYPKTHDIVTLVSEVAYFLEANDASSVSITVVPSDDSIIAPVDETKLWSVLHNLINNAYEALEGQANGDIKIYVTELTTERPYTINGKNLPKGDYVQIDVVDNGPGISPEIIDYIFTPKVSTKSPNGRGWGLSNVKEIVELHGGAVSVQSDYDTEHSGTGFKVILPPKTVNSSVDDLKTPEDLSGVIVLVVDDDEDQRYVLKEIGERLNPEGFNTFGCECDLNGWITENEGDLSSDLLFILDNQLPGRHGLDFAPDLHERFPNATIILATGDLDDRKMEKIQPLVDSGVLDSALEKRAGGGANDPQNWLQIIAERKRKVDSAGNMG